MSSGPSTRRRSTRLSSRQPSPPRSPTPASDSPSLISSPAATPLKGDDAADASSEDDEEGVFFGSHDPAELQMLAKLSLRASPSVVASPMHESRRLSRIVRVKKRDSREFLRRKTLLVSQKENDEDDERPSPDKAKGCSLKAVPTPRPVNNQPDTRATKTSPAASAARSPLRQLPIPDESPTRIGSDASNIDLTAHLANLQLSSCSPSRPAIAEPVGTDAGSDDSEEEEEEEEEDDEDYQDDENYSSEDSDKENAAPPSPLSPRSTSLEKSFDADKPLLIVGMNDKAVIEVLTGSKDGDTEKQLDMGGAHPSDFSDPDEGSQSLRSPKLSDDGLPSSPDAVLDLFLAPAATDLHFHQQRNSSFTAQQAEIQLSSLAMPAKDSTCHVLAEQEANSAFDTDEVVAELVTGDMDCEDSTPPPSSVNTSSLSVSTDDSPLPIGRAGPVIIPKIATHLGSIRAESGSPFRPLPPYDSPPVLRAPLDLELYNDVTVDCLSLSVSPERSHIKATTSTPTTATPRHLQPLPTAPAPQSVPTHVTPTLGKFAYVSALGMGPSRPAKLLQASHPVVKPQQSSALHGSRQRVASESAARDPKTAARALAVRSQLDAAYTSTSKLSQFGPPQRSASGSSGSSSSAPNRKPAIPSRTPLANPSKPPSSVRSASSNAAKVVPSSSVAAKSAKLAAQTQPASAKQAPRPAPAPSARPTLAAPAVRPVQIPSAKPINSIGAMSRPPIPTRPAAKGGKPVIRAAIGGSTFNKTKPAPLASRPPISAINQQAKEGSASPVGSNPLKRPLPVGVVTSARPAVMATGTENVAPPARPVLGLPSRINRDGTSSVGSGVFGEYSQFGGPPVRPAGGGLFKSPIRPTGHRRLFVDGPAATPMSARKLNLGTPSRGLGTPSQAITHAQGASAEMPVSGPVAAVLATANRPSHSVGDVTARQSGTKGDDQVVHLRGSSEDQEEVSFALPQAPSSDSTPSSPTSTDAGRTPRVGDKVLRTRHGSPPPSAPGSSASTVKGKRVLKPPSVIAPAARVRPSTVPLSGTIIPNVSQKELTATTHINTMRNQVYLCAIDRQIIRKQGARPPSPTSKIRTMAEKEEAEKKAGRSARAKRRAKGSGAEEDEEEEEMPAIERVEQARMQGDEEDWVTPARPAKRAKLAHAEGGHGRQEKSVKWDKGLVVIRDDGARAPLSRTGSGNEVLPRGALRQDVDVLLDAQGNLIEANRPKEALKRTKVTVTAVFYDGEEPVPGVPIYNRPEAIGTAPITTAPQSGPSKSKKKS